MKKLSTIVLAILCLSLSCCDMIDYHPYDVHIKGEKDINKHNIARIEETCKGKDTIRFIAFGDTQGWYDETIEFVKSANQQKDIDFAIHDGDISDYGVTQEFTMQRDILNDLNVPYVVIIGNHDILGTGTDAFRAIFGETNFSFMAGDVKFININTNALEYDYSEPVPDLNFLITEARTGDLKKAVLAMHAAPFTDVFNNNIADVFNLYTEEIPGLQFCLNGHYHKFEITDHFNNGILYYQTASIEKRSYIIFTIYPDRYEYELVNF